MMFINTNLEIFNFNKILLTIDRQVSSGTSSTYFAMIISLN